MSKCIIVNKVKGRFNIVFFCSKNQKIAKIGIQCFEF